MYSLYGGLGYMKNEPINLIKMCESIWGVKPPRKAVVIVKKKRDDADCDDCAVCDSNCGDTERSVGN
jgi:hypothetical protein